MLNGGEITILISEAERRPASALRQTWRTWAVSDQQAEPIRRPGTVAEQSEVRCV